MKKVILAVLVLVCITGIVYAQQNVASEQGNIPKKLEGKTTEEIVKLGENHLAIRQYIWLFKGTPTNEQISEGAVEKIIVGQIELGYGGVMENLLRVNGIDAQYKDKKWIDEQIANCGVMKDKLLLMKQKLEDPKEPIVAE